MSTDDINIKKRIAIAKACGWSNFVLQEDGWVWGRMPLPHPADEDSSGMRTLPDYLNDLNAMREAEKVLIARGGLPTYEHFLQYNEIKKGSEPWYGSIHATAAQRADAFIATLNLSLE